MSAAAAVRLRRKTFFCFGVSLYSFKKKSPVSDGGLPIDRPLAGRWSVQRTDHGPSVGRTMDRPLVGPGGPGPPYTFVHPPDAKIGTQNRKNVKNAEITVEKANYAISAETDVDSAEMYTFAKM